MDSRRYEEGISTEIDASGPDAVNDAAVRELSTLFPSVGVDDVIAALQNTGGDVAAAAEILFQQSPPDCDHTKALLAPCAGFRTSPNGVYSDDAMLLIHTRANTPPRTKEDPPPEITVPETVEVGVRGVRQMARSALGEGNEITPRSTRATVASPEAEDEDGCSLLTETLGPMEMSSPCSPLSFPMSPAHPMPTPLSPSVLSPVEGSLEGGGGGGGASAKDAREWFARKKTLKKFVPEATSKEVDTVLKKHASDAIAMEALRLVVDERKRRKECTSAGGAPRKKVKLTEEEKTVCKQK